MALGWRGGHQQVNVIAHQHIGMDFTFIILSRVSQLNQVKPVIVLPEKTRLAVVPPLRHMLRKTRQRKSWLSRHEDGFSKHTPPSLYSHQFATSVSPHRTNLSAFSYKNVSDPNGKPERLSVEKGE